ncbi:MAG: SDR family NAD(P)-dependent oxidoreductase [Burkholderiaceae bacterium]|nr:SDR family NAD(P)-dependent oxidoreductase [Burkholderiaceae bacterium]
MPSHKKSRPVALVTGASSGIGEALAGLFAAAGHDRVLGAHSADKLKALAATLAARHGVRVRVEPADLSAPGAAETLAARLKRAREPVDVLVNNAGVLAQGRFAAMDAASHQQIIDLNISGLTAMLSAFMPAMVARGAGRVLNVASIASFQPVPSLATYAASKAYVLSLTESLSEELRGSGVSITALCPGITATGMLDQVVGANPQVSRIPGFLIGDVTDVARQGFDACMKGDVICVPGVVNQAAMLASRSTPKWLLRRISGLLGRQVV